MNKVKPNKNALMNGSINCTQKSRKTGKIKEERGLTLIALIVMTIILVILSAVAIRWMRGCYDFKRNPVIVDMKGFDKIF